MVAGYILNIRVYRHALIKVCHFTCSGIMTKSFSQYFNVHSKMPVLLSDLDFFLA